MVEKAFNLIFELNAVPLYKAEYYIENYIDICVNRWKKKKSEKLYQDFSSNRSTEYKGHYFKSSGLCHELGRSKYKF